MTNKHIELPALKTVAWLLTMADGSQETWFTDPVGLDPRWSDVPSRVQAVVLREDALAAIAAHEQARVVGEPVAPNNDVDLLLRQVFELCEETEGAPEVEPKNEHQRGYDRGRRFEAKSIRRAIGTWFQDTFCGRSFMGEPAIAAPVAQPASEQAEAPSDADPLTPEQEEWVMDLAEKHNLGRRVPQIGAMRGVAPDVFYTDASYRTHELFCFAAALLSTKELT